MLVSIVDAEKTLGLAKDYTSAQIVCCFISQFIHRSMEANTVPDKCSDEICQSVKKHLEVQGVLHTAPFCSGRKKQKPMHLLAANMFIDECSTESCAAKKALGKDHCSKRKSRTAFSQ